MTPVLSPPDLKPPGYNSEETPSHSNARGRRTLLWGLAALLFALALIVVFILPAKIPQQDQPQVARVQDQQTEAARDISSVAQQDAKLALQAFLRLRAQPELQDAQLWAPDVWLLAMTASDLGDGHYGYRRFKDARLAYEAATQHLNQLQSDRPQILLDTLAYAQASLEEDNIAPSISAFERVLAMQANHPQATIGLTQARVRERILDLMEDGQRAQSTGRLTDAAGVYEKALQLDTNYQPARSELAKVSDQLAGLEYQDAMSRALNALKAGDLNEADVALKQAAKIKPDAIELQDTRQRLQSARQKSALNSLRKQAQKLTINEQWSDAAKQYKKALDIDGQAAFARSGLAHAKSREALNLQLDHYLDTPERLSSDEPLNNAKILLEANAAPPENEPLLTDKLSALREAIEAASTPITLVIESDSHTQVTIYHVGRLGAFAHKEIELRPGQYTVTGVREGYRDVRKVISLSPTTSQHLSIRCVEPI